MMDSTSPCMARMLSLRMRSTRLIGLPFGYGWLRLVQRDDDSEVHAIRPNCVEALVVDEKDFAGQAQAHFEGFLDLLNGLCCAGRTSDGSAVSTPPLDLDVHFIFGYG